MNSVATPQRKKSVWTKMGRHWQFYLIVALPMLYFILFKYVPMYGILLGFKRYRVSKGIWGSPWVGSTSSPSSSRTPRA